MSNILNIKEPSSKVGFVELVRVDRVSNVSRMFPEKKKLEAFTPKKDWEQKKVASAFIEMEGLI